MQSVNKRTKSKYSKNAIKRILRYNQERVDEANKNKMLHQLMDKTIGKMFGGSLFNVLGYDRSINETMMPTTPQNTFKLSRK